MFHLHLKRMCILLLSGRILFLCKLSSFNLMCHLRQGFPYCMSRWSVHWCKWDVKVPDCYYLLSVSPIISINIHLIYLGAHIWGAYTFTFVISFSWIYPLIIMCCPPLSLPAVLILQSVLSKYCYSGCLLIPFVWNTCFHFLTLALCVSLDLKWVSCRQHVYGSCFCIQSAILCLLVGAFRQFKIKIITEMYLLPFC